MVLVKTEDAAAEIAVVDIDVPPIRSCQSFEPINSVFSRECQWKTQKKMELKLT